MALTTTLNNSYGAAFTVPGGQFLLNNEMDDFTTAPGAVNAMGLVQGDNAIAPGKRMLSSMTPTLVLDSAGALVLVTGAAGGRTSSPVSPIRSCRCSTFTNHWARRWRPRVHFQDQPDSLIIERVAWADTAATLMAPLGARGEAIAVGRSGEHAEAAFTARQEVARGLGAARFRSSQGVLRCPIDASSFISSPRVRCSRRRGRSRFLHDLVSSSPRRSADALGLVHQAGPAAAGGHRLRGRRARCLRFRAGCQAQHSGSALGLSRATGTDDDGTIRANARLFPVGASGAATDQRGESGWQRFAAGDQLPHTDRHQSGGEPKRFIRSEKSRWHGRPRPGTLQVLSTVATTSIEDAIAARGATVWFQLYHHPTNWAITKQMVQRAERAGSAAVVFTVDLLGGSNRETMLRDGRLDKRVCSGCHIGGQPIPGMRSATTGDQRRKPNLNRYPQVDPIPEVGTPSWEFVDGSRRRRA